MEIRLSSNLCEVAPTIIEDLHMADYQRLQELYQGFLKGRFAVVDVLSGPLVDGFRKGFLLYRRPAP